MTGTDRPLRIFISAGEVSGDVLGGRLMDALRRLSPREIEFRGIGGPDMTAHGLDSLFPISELAVMGLVEIIPHIPRLKRRIAETAAAVTAFQPDVLVTIDAPGFNKRLAAACGETSFPKVHYVAPTVWAWRPGRVHKFKALFDRLLCLLPFEPPYFAAVGLKAPFVGHSVIESGADRGDGAGFRRRNGIAATATVLCLLPGSRRGEVARLLPTFRTVVEGVAGRVPGLHVVLPTVPHLTDTLSGLIADWTVPVTLVTDSTQKYDAMAAANGALAASGTVALELAMARVPTVIAYRINALTYAVIMRLVTTDFAHLINILAQREIVRERIQAQCRSDLLIDDVMGLLGPDGAHQVDAVQPYLAQLSPGDGLTPSEAAAREVLDAISAC